ASRVAMAERAARELSVICVLKGYQTVISDGTQTYINPTGNAAMAAGGMGDVLTGLIGALLAQGAAPLEAACAGVFLHGLAADVGEFGWLQGLLPKLYWPASLNSQLWIGAGDDAGVLGISPGNGLVATTDAMVEGIHFEKRWFPWEDLGFKILAVNLSDLAAMGAVKPLAALVTAALPGDTPVETVDKFYRGLETCAQRWKVGLLGGDTVGSKRDWMVSVTVF